MQNNTYTTIVVHYDNASVVMINGVIVATTDPDDGAMMDREAFDEVVNRLASSSGKSPVVMELSSEEIMHAIGVAGDDVSFDDMALLAEQRLNEKHLGDIMPDAAVLIVDGDAFRVSSYDDDERVVDVREEESGVERTFDIKVLAKEGCKVMGFITLHDSVRRT